jgi:hypothetical protein
MEEVIAKFSQVTPQERTKRKFESLEVSLFSHNQMKFLVNFDP